MFIELRPLKRKDSGQIMASLLSALGQVIADYHQKPAYQEILRTAHVSFDWIQYKNNFRPPIAERPALGIDFQDVHRRELQIDLRQVNTDTFADELRRMLDRWQPITPPPEAQQEMLQPALDRLGHADLAIAVAVKPKTKPDIDGDKLYLEPFQPARNSIIWSFNSLYWNALDKWEATFHKGYEAALPGGVTDACNPEFVAESVKHVCDMLDELQRKGQLPDQIFVLEIGVGNGAQARTWLDAFQRYTSEAHTDYYHRLHYLMSDFSSCVLNVARDAVIPHLEKVSFLVMDATDPLKSLSFLRYKLMFVHISNVYDNLPSSELVRWDNQYYLVEVRAYLPRDEAGKISEQYGLDKRNLGMTITRFLKVGPDYFDETDQGVRFWADVWHALKLEERCVLLTELSQLKLFEGFDGRDAQMLLDQVSGNLRMHLNEMALKSFVNTVPLLHPRGFFQVQDIFITDLQQYYSAFRGPGKYDGSVVNWVNGPLLRLVGNRFGYDVHFQPFSYRQNSNIIILTTTMRD